MSRLRILAIAIYVAVVLLMILWAISDVIFNDNQRNVRGCVRRIALSFLWPIAVFSKAGRNVLFTNFNEGI